MEMNLTAKQYASLEGLAYWIAQHSYMSERYGIEDPEMPRIDDTIHMCFEECDVLQIPYWVQNATITFGRDWRYAEGHYLTSYLETRNIHRMRG